MTRLALPLLALALLAGCQAARPAAAPRPAAALAARGADAPVITAVLGNGQAAPTFATWLGRPLALTAQVEAPKGSTLVYRWTTDGAFDGRADGKTVRFLADTWGDFRATFEVTDAKGRTATRSVKIAVWPAAE